jgi:hypothetical protein
VVEISEPPKMETDQGTEEMSMEDLKRLRDLGLNDLYFFTRGILGYRDLVPRVHRKMCQYLQDTAPGSRSLLLAPRSHFKTTLGLANDLREICRNPNIRILLANESGLNASSMLEEIKQHILNNQRFRAFYPYIIPKNTSDATWNRQAILLPRQLIAREPTIMTIGVGGAVVSLHFNFLDFDDLVGEEAFQSPPVMKRAVDWLNHSVSLLISPDEDRMLLRGTRWRFNDLYAHAMENMGFGHQRSKAIITNQTTGKIEPLFKERFSLEFFASIMEADPEQWAAQYANDPADVAFADFQRDWLRWYTVAPDGDIRWKDFDGTIHKQEMKKLRIYAHVDPSVGDTPDSDSQAVVVVGVNEQGQVFLLDTWQLRVDPLMLIEKLFEVDDRFSPTLFSIEATAFQKSLRYFVEKEAQRRGRFLRIEDYQPSTRKSKAARIRGALQPFFSSGMIFCRERQINFIEQFLAFGRTDDEHMMDALAQGPKYWRSPRDDAGLERFQRFRGALTGRKNRGLSGYGV